jgi:hypothetical protein
MSQEKRAAEHEWVLKMVALEAELGPIVPGGAVGGASARARLAAERKTAQAANRARNHVRFVAYAIATTQQQAA